MSTLPQGDPGWDANGSPASGAATPAAIVAGLRPCEFDACEGLTGRQKRFASKRCAQAWYDLHRPRVLAAAAGAAREGTILAALLGLLADGEWHDLMSLSAELKALPCSVSARIREARPKGFRVARDLKRGDVARPHRYRLLLNKRHCITGHYIPDGHDRCSVMQCGPCWAGSTEAVRRG